MYKEAIITFIDILGFKNLVLKSSFEVVSDALAAIERFSGINDQSFDDDEDDNPKVIQFSDSIIRIRPISSKNRYGAMYFEMSDLVHIQGELIKHKICIRGGVAIGLVHNDEKLIFGPGFISAYELESIYANYPRIVLQPNLIKRFIEDESLYAEDHSAEEEINHIKKFISKGDDGIYFVNYMRAFLDELDYKEYQPKFIKSHKDLIVSNALGASELNSVTAKYLWMANYHNRIVSSLSSDYFGTRKEKYFLISEKDFPLLKSF